MLAVVLTMCAGLVAGAVVGRRLAARGLTAENALTGRQRVAYAVFIGAAAGFALLYWAHKIPLLPTWFVLLGEAAVWPLVLLIASAAFSLLIALEWPGRGDRKRLGAMLAGAAVLAFANAFLTWRLVPLAGSLAPARVVDGVIMQTTSYTCAPAAIATLLRALGDTAASEASMVALAGTSRTGTTTFREVQTMERLGLEPEFLRRLTPLDLARRGQIALLHVDEPVLATTVRHAVALLAVDSLRRTVTLGNPMYGVVVKSWASLPGYWTGETIFVRRRPTPRPAAE